MPPNSNNHENGGDKLSTRESSNVTDSTADHSEMSIEVEDHNMMALDDTVFRQDEMPVTIHVQEHQETSHTPKSKATPSTPTLVFDVEGVTTGMGVSVLSSDELAAAILNQSTTSSSVPYNDEEMLLDNDDNITCRDKLQRPRYKLLVALLCLLVTIVLATALTAGLRDGTEPFPYGSPASGNNDTPTLQPQPPENNNDNNSQPPQEDPPIPPPPPPAVDTQQQQQDELEVQNWLESHNTRRRALYKQNNVEMVDLKWSRGLADSAQIYAQRLIGIEGCEILHGYQGDRYGGENLAMQWNAQPDQEWSAESVLEAWYDDEKDLKDRNKIHYLQVIWRATHYVGCARATKKIWDGHCFIQVCRYIRPGNCNVDWTNWTQVEQQALRDKTPCGPSCPPEGCT